MNLIGWSALKRVLTRVLLALLLMKAFFLLRLEEMVNEDAIKVKSANGTQLRDTVVLPS